MLNEENLKNLQIFLNRVDIKGNESIPHADILIKIGRMLVNVRQPPAPGEVPIEEPTKPPLKEVGEGKK